MSVVSDNLKFLRKKQGITQAVLADSLGISKSAVSMLENGQRLPSFEMLEALADFYNVSLSYLCGEEIPSVVRIPVVGSVQAGIPTQAIEDVVDWEEIPKSMAQRGDYIGLKVKGASMEPRFVEGDTVIVRRQPDIESGEIAVVLVNGDEATMKRVIKSSDGIMLVATNTSVYEPHFYSNQQVADLPVVIYGKIIELRGKF